MSLEADMNRAIGRAEVEREVMWIIAALARRTDGRALRITYAEVLKVKPGARILRHEDPGGRFIEYHLCED